MIDDKGHALDAVAHIIDKDPDSLKHQIEYGPIASCLKKHEPGALVELQSRSERR